MDLSKTCRLCLFEQESDELKLIVSTCSENISYQEMLKYCTGLDIEDKDDFPTRICRECEVLLLKLYQFKNQIITSIEKLQRTIVKNNLTACSSNIVELKIEKISELPDTSEDLIKSDQEYLDNDSYWDYLSQNNENSDEIEIQRSNTSKSLQDETEVDICGVTSDKDKPNEMKQVKKRKYISRKNYRDLCLVCGKLVYNLLVHSRTHLDPKDRPRKHVCTLCPRKFCVKNDLTVHMRKHIGEKRYECEYCGKKFHEWGSRRNHIYSIHTGQHRYTCHICDRKFVIKTSYTAHLLRHTGDKPEMCEICGKGFITKILLKKHQLSHTNERKYECELCHKLYKTARSLCEHMKIHNRERNCKCPVCSLAFIQNHVLKAHVTKKHPEYQLPPPGTIVSQKALLKKEQHELAKMDLIKHNKENNCIDAD